MDISIVIVNYKSKDLVFNCLRSIFQADFSLPEKRLVFEIFVIDNDSRDGIGADLAEHFPEVIFIQNHKNVGMGAGNNIGLKKAKGDYVVVMNPDTTAFTDTFIKLYQYMEKNPAVGLIGPRQLNPDRSIQNSCYRWPTLFVPIYRRTPAGLLPFARKKLSRYLMEDFDHQSEREVDWLLGSFFFIRSEAMKKIGLFDERFFLYFEDTDYCRRFWKQGWKLVYYPLAEIVHNHNRQSAQTPWYSFFSNRAARQHIISWLKYLYKWKFQKI